MQTEIAQPENISAFAAILHDLCQPLTALECSLELALLPGVPSAQVHSYTATALAAARRLHLLALQMQQIDRMCRNYRRPRVLSFAEVAAIFSLSDQTGSNANLYIDIAGLGYAIQQLPRTWPLSGSIHRRGSVAFITIAITPQVGEELPPDPQFSALVEHLGGQFTLTESEAVFQFLIH